MTPTSRRPWHALGVHEAITALHTTARGLTDAQANTRLRQYGPNEVAVHDGAEGWRILGRQFTDPMILILVAAGVVSLALSARVDALIIFAAVGINAAVGFFQEHKVSAILAQLRQHLKQSATVLRDGNPRVIDARQIVPGDVVIVQQGDRVPADARILEASSLRTNEAALTGESMPVEKSPRNVSADAPVADRSDLVFMGTLVEEGTARVAVIATGSATEFGAIARLVVAERGKDVTPLQMRLRKLALTLGVVFVGASSILFLAGIASGRDPLTMLLTAVAVAVAAVPESLPVSVSVVLAIGARHILAKGGLVRKMAAAETLGSVTVVATDKTATLTEGRMAVDRLVFTDGREVLAGEFQSQAERDPVFRALVERMAVSGNAFVEQPIAPAGQVRFVGRPIERALLHAAVDMGIEPEELKSRYERLAEIPFDARRKYAAFLVRGPDGERVFVLGAPEVVLAASIIDSQGRAGMERYIERSTADGLRVLAFASRHYASVGASISPDDIHELSFEALVAFADPLRSDIREVIVTAQDAGIRLVMVTGDHHQTAEYIARQTNILASPGRTIDGADFPDDASLVLDRYDVYARVSPADKVRIVQGFQARGETVAMIGDGVNDAPALLRADIGVAVGSGTDVAKEASDLVLIGDSFKILVEAIRQGRIIFDNILKVSLFLLSSAFTEIVLVGGSILLGLPLALLPAQILWVNIIVDVMPAISLAWDRNGEDVMRQPPRRVGKMFSGGIRKLIVLFSAITDTALFALFAILLAQGNSVEYARTMAFTGLGITSLVYIFSVRSLSRPVWRTTPFSNRLLNASVLIGLGLYAIAIYVGPVQHLLGTVPLAAGDWGILVVLSVLNVAIFELGKRLFFSRDGMIT